MTENEMKLLEMIRKNNNPEQALLTAVKVIVDYLNRHESTESISSVASIETTLDFAKQLQSSVTPFVADSRGRA